MPDPLTRRSLIASAGVFAAAAMAPRLASARPGKPGFAYVGCRTTRERNARGDGIEVYRIDAGDGAWTHLQTVGSLVNPSFLCLDRSGRFLYAVHGDSSDLSAFGIDRKRGTLSPIGRQSAHGVNPVHIAIDPSNRFAIVTNHFANGAFQPGLAVFPLQEDGGLGVPTDVVALDGKTGPHPTEQPYAKPHQAAFDPTGRLIVVPDKGCDLVRTYRLGGDGKLAAAAPPAKARDGAGPRHVAFHPAKPFAYVVNELDSTVVFHHLDAETGVLTPAQWLPTTPDDYLGIGRASEIEVSPDGRFLYVSNRGHDSIAGFAIDQTSGRLASAFWHSSGGRTPRFFALAPGAQTLYAANEDGDNIVALAVDRIHGLLSDKGVAAATGSPTSIVFGCSE